MDNDSQKDLECQLHDKQETIDALLEENTELKKDKKYFVSILYPTGAVMGRMPEVSGIFDTKEQVNGWIERFKADPMVHIENIVVVFGQQIPVVIEQKKIQSVAFKKDFVGI